jgi:lipid II:glycine glycyltransferase (peptidoglycan interpeptide bridge formation enzyme)
MIKILTYHEIDIQQWNELVQSSPTATWFQTKEAYEFYASNSKEMIPFAFGVEREGELRAAIVGYVTKERSTLKQFFTRRAIIIGGPLLAEDTTETDVEQLLRMMVSELKSQAIYIETRNFHDYSKWRHVFEQCGFTYQPHLNFHVDTSSVEIVDKNLGKSRKRDIRTTIRDGVTPVLEPTIEQVCEYYAILKDLYTTKVKTPLFGWHFFEQLYHSPSGRFILTEYQGKIIGGTVCVVLPNKAVYEWFVCGVDGVYEHIFPSSYATYLGIRYAAENGCQIFDMMGAGKPEEAYGVRDFKARFGGEQVEYGRYLCVRKPLLYKIGKLGVKLLKKR